MIRLPVLNSEKSKACWWQYLFFSQRVLHNKKRLTPRAPRSRYARRGERLDAGDSAAILSSFLRLSLFLVGQLRRPRPHAGNAHCELTQDL